jgi:GNAT superfamily N-acetyltransferase
LFTRHVLEQAGEIIGYGYSMCTDPQTNTFRFAVYFLPHWQTAGVIDTFYRYVMSRCLDHSPAVLLSMTREDEPAKIAWLRNQGFEEVMRYPCSILQVDRFDPRAYDTLQAELAAQGIEIVSLVELAERDPAWQRKVYDLEMLLSQDVPRPSTFVPPPFEQYRPGYFDDPSFLPHLWFIALHDGHYIGTTSLFQTGDDPRLLENYLTGTRRDYRRRGLATALKCRAIQEAQRLGAQRIITYNEENNPMYRLNLNLGFQPQPADVDWEKKDLSDLPGF